MASKKRKFTFTDLADDDFVSHQQNKISNVDDNLNKNTNFTLNDLKSVKTQNTNSTNNVQENIENKPSNIVEEKQVISPGPQKLEQDQQEEEIVFEKLNLDSDEKTIETNSSNNSENNLQNNNTNSSTSTTKKVYEVNYDDILEKPVNEEKQKIIDNLVDKKDPIKELFNTKEEKQEESLNEEDLENKTYKNLKPRSTVKTYNEAIKRQEQRQVDVHFEENKIKQFLNVKEKLEVKTNIYLKNSIVIKLSELEARTNESRSSIINKLIEIALKTIEE